MHGYPISWSGSDRLDGGGVGWREGCTYWLLVVDKRRLQSDKSTCRPVLVLAQSVHTAIYIKCPLRLLLLITSFVRVALCMHTTWDHLDEKLQQGEIKYCNDWAEEIHDSISSMLCHCIQQLSCISASLLILLVYQQIWHVYQYSACTHGIIWTKEHQH